MAGCGKIENLRFFNITLKETQVFVDYRIIKFFKLFLKIQKKTKVIANYGSTNKPKTMTIYKKSQTIPRPKAGLGTIGLNVPAATGVESYS